MYEEQATTEQAVTRTNTPQLPGDFGLSWGEFAQKWCFGGSLGYSQDESVRALDALKRLWPERVSELLADSCRGLNIVTGSIESGRLLADCELMHGFASVLDRLKQGERSAYSELVLCSSLFRLGLCPAFNAELNGKVLDARCEVEGRPVYFEVLAPDRADHSIDTQGLADELSQAIRASVSACRIEVEVLATLDRPTIQQIADAVHDATPGEWVTIQSIARIRRINEGQRLHSTFDGDGTSIAFAAECEVQGPTTGVVIRWEDSDERAKRLFSGEYHHFSQEVPNVLVVNVCAVADGMNAWTACANQVFQPTRNRKVGAVVLFRQGSLGPPEAICRQWRAIVNPYSYLAIPQSLIQGFESLDQSERLFGERHP